MFFFRLSSIARRRLGLTLLSFVLLGTVTGQWMKPILHIHGFHPESAYDFTFGLAIGLGLAFVVYSFSSDPAPKDGDSLHII